MHEEARRQASRVNVSSSKRAEKRGEKTEKGLIKLKNWNKSRESRDLIG